MQKEIWKDIAGYEGLYQVSNLGRVRTLQKKYTKYPDGKILKLPLTHRGYLRVQLWKNSEMKHFYVHRLVAKAFIPNPKKLPQVNHINENKTDNEVCNLEWVSQEYNLNYGTHNKRAAFANINHPSKSKPVECYTESGELFGIFPSVREAERKTRVWNASIIRCCKGKSKTAGGYVWKYQQGDENGTTRN